ncbi:MAG: hypothetical protein IH973_13685 [Myxococcales bacterium]|nr:hypothetical protein [Myxococcales bacterium]
MTAATIPAAEVAARIARLITGLPIGADHLTPEQVSGAFFRVSFEAEKLGREYAAQQGCGACLQELPPTDEPFARSDVSAGQGSFIPDEQIRILVLAPDLGVGRQWHVHHT